ADRLTSLRPRAETRPKGASRRTGSRRSGVDGDSRSPLGPRKSEGLSAFYGLDLACRRFMLARPISGRLVQARGLKMRKLAIAVVTAAALMMSSFSTTPARADGGATLAILAGAV